MREYSQVLLRDQQIINFTICIYVYVLFVCMLRKLNIRNTYLYYMYIDTYYH